MTSDLTETHIHVLVAAAGHGARAGGPLPKQYQPVAGIPMVVRTIMAFDRVSRISSISTVVAPDDAFPSMPPSLDHTPRRMTVGASTRAQSVLNGLNGIAQSGADENDWVMVHDAARCLVLPSQIDALIDACLATGEGGLIAQPLADTLKVQTTDSDGLARSGSTVSRSGKWLAQTPQMFRLGELIAALDDALREDPDAITDEASAMERAGKQPLLVKGSAENFKVTYPEDFALAAAIVEARGVQNPASIDHPFHPFHPFLRENTA